MIIENDWYLYQRINNYSKNNNWEVEIIWTVLIKHNPDWTIEEVYDNL